MKEQLISFETAKLAKEKGFDIYDGWFNELGNHLGRTDLNKEGKTFTEVYPEEKSAYGSAIKEEHKKEFKIESFPCSTQSLLQKWLREVHKLSVEVGVYEDEWEYAIYTIGSQMSNKGAVNNYKTYEEALEKGLQKALKLIK